MNVDKIKLMHLTRYRSDLKQALSVPNVNGISVFVKSRPVGRLQKSMNDFRKYRAQVWGFTELVKDLIPGIEKRGFTDHHIDHKISIWRGFKSGIPPNYIGGLENLRMIPHRENMAKGTKSIYE